MKRIFTVLLLLILSVMGCGSATSLAESTIENSKGVFESSKETVPEVYMVNDDNAIAY